MDSNTKLEELKALLQSKGIDLSEPNESEEKPSTRIADAAANELMVAGGSGTVWASWSRGVKQVSGGCIGNESK